MSLRTLFVFAVLFLIVPPSQASPQPIPQTPATVAAAGTLATHSGPSIYDFQLKQMLDEFIPEGNAHSRLLIFTECYGGDKLDEFAGDAKTTVLSATAPSEPAYYGGYHDDAAQALAPAAGKTSADVHAAGVAGKDAAENPQSQGPGASLTPTDPAGPIKSRHVLVYAGKPNAQDEADRATIEANFAGAANTTVTTVGSNGGGNWDYPGTLNGLRDALQTIQDEMSPDEQFILFVTDHGNYDVVDFAPDCSESTSCVSASLALGPDIYADMVSDPDNQPALTVFSPGEIQPSRIDVEIVGFSFIGNIPFDQPIDLNGDGDLLDANEGWQAQLLLSDPLINPAGLVFQLSEGDPSTRPAGPSALSLSFISLESGHIQKCSAPAAPAPTGNLDNGNVHLSWTAVPGALSYNIYRGNTPYFSPTTAHDSTTTLNWTDTAGTTGNVDVHTFYVVKTVNACGVSVDHQRIGEFEFSIAPGV